MIQQRRSDSALFAEERRELVALLRQSGISDEMVLSAVGTVPRHLFVEECLQHRAYENRSLPIACSQTISQPYTVAFMTQLVRITRGVKVLEVGTGSGYQAAILAAMGARVFTIERHFDLLQLARTRFDALRYNIASKMGDGTVGWSDYSPFDRMLVTAGSPDIPRSLLNQLADGGILVIPVGSEQSQTMNVVERRGDTFSTTAVDSFTFVPLIGKEGWRR